MKKNILYIGKIDAGKKHDFSIYKEEFKDINFSNHTIWVDLGFIGIEKLYEKSDGLVKIEIPHKSTKKNPITEEQQKENHQKSSKRVVVENSLASLKTFFLLKNRHRTLNLNEIEFNVHICGGLANFKNKPNSLKNQIPQRL